MATAESSVVKLASLAPVSQVPELCAGDRLTRPEFERRYSAMPNVKKAELVEGMVYMPSPVSKNHARPHFDIITCLGIYRFATPGVQGSDNGTVRLDGENEPQPDAFLRIAPECGGQSRDDDDYVAGPPELIAEISVTSESYDLHDKLRAYQRNGVREYLVWRVWDSAIDWFVSAGRAVRARAGDRSGSLSERGLSGPLARSGRLAARRRRPGPGGTSAGNCLARARCIRREAPGGIRPHGFLGSDDGLSRREWPFVIRHSTFVIRHSSFAFGGTRVTRPTLH